MSVTVIKISSSQGYENGQGKPVPIGEEQEDVFPEVDALFLFLV
jgi:hypothetical protein